ncbi:CubicO group peptidase, beta-lactamase class C family [Actinopolymorpha cephalotaxi]|uniref:CubicO group peptidase (Beta-lactamase class C family) n=1 Tax=Actinopolymorpha cephalotaxi TaxID=504797 RepID=A0A1I2N626_9ACTN|nr:serine hydrolase domain-containing protein [Actinopolymorpha cephalotaxi]NYH85665.1 CubicO group peptidase (beta-lactamase class C family) [Actinopolymorpha cephalotaxi]SFF99222.1 CubicO group peptidase, beta-lactamase class C family [Actinopolymorpha cephalotaxi]
MTPVADVQQQVQRAVDEAVRSGREQGVQVAAYLHGEQIVDAVAGLADPATGRPVTSGTVFYAYSAGKGATATVAHVLAEQGVLDYDLRLADVWPEFGVHGKDGATLRHVLTHTVGVPAIPSDTTPEDVCDWDRMCARIAAAEPWWEPGAKTAYHAYTFGYLVGEVVRRVTGRPISRVLAEDVAGPLGVAGELYFGMPVSEHGRLARLEDAEGSAEFMAALPDDSPFFALSPRDLTPTAEFGNRTDILAADIPAGAKLTARATARMYAALLGPVDGVRLVSPERLKELSAVSFTGDDQVMGMPSRWALGYSVGRIGADQEQTSGTFGMGGAGGTYAFGDTSTGLAFALTKNRLTSDFDTAERIATLVADAV